MDCKQTAADLSARMDGETTAAPPAAIEQHLADCRDCRTLDADLHKQDTDLRAAFSRRRETIAHLADRVVHALREDHNPRPTVLRWWHLVGSIAAGFVLAIALLRPLPPANHNTTHTPVVASMLPIGHVALATGPLQMRADDSHPWSTVSAGTMIPGGSWIQTPSAVRCEIVLDDGSRVRLNGGTEIGVWPDRRVQLARGELWTSASEANQPMRLCADDLTFRANDAQFNVRADADHWFVTVIDGSPDVAGPDWDAPLQVGETMRISHDGVEDRYCEADLLLATRWMNELLVRRGVDDPELVGRIYALLAAMDHTQASAMYERELRLLGDGSAPSLVRFVRSYCSNDTAAARTCIQRKEAARILGDIAPIQTVPDLIELLQCSDTDVRYHAARALQRLTKVDLDIPAARFRQPQCDPCERVGHTWQRWWEESPDSAFP